MNNDYVTFVKGLASNQFHKINFGPWEIARILSNAAEAGELVDMVKKSLFYNKPVDELAINAVLIDGAPDTDGEIDQIPVDTLHGVLGVVSEAAEFADELARAITDRRPVDAVNLKEEAGDLLWYVALLIHSLGISFEEVVNANIRKLETRYPDKKFNRDRALNRDLKAEHLKLVQ